MTTPESQVRRAPGDGPSAGLCSQLSAERGLPLIGSAGCYDGVLAFELDAPWTPRLAGSRASDGGLDAAIGRIATGARGVRLLALEPREPLPQHARRESVRVLHFFKSKGPFGAFSRREYDVRRDDLAASLERLAAGGLAGAEEISGPDGQRDILVCTHGARDACCGKFGYRLFLEMSASAGPLHEIHEPLRVWRSSHLGGHRFAPTLLDLPSGRMYGRMTDGDAATVLGGGAALVARLSSIYRGRCALPEAAQIVERELWARAGATFELAALRWQVDEVVAGWCVRIDAERVGAPPLSMTAQVIRADIDAVETPASCGRDPESEAPWRILS